MKKISVLTAVLIFAVGIIFAQPTWTVNPAEYNLDFTITGAINVGGAISADESDIVAAFDESNVVRGVANVVYNATVDEYFINMTIFSNTVGDSISFKMYDASADQEIDAVNSKIAFEPNAIIGSVFTPFVISDENKVTGIDLNTYSVQENNTANQSVATISTIMPSPLDIAFTYSLVAGEGDADNASFEIEGDKLIALESFNYEQKSEYLIRLKSSTTSHGSIEKAFVINIEDDTSETATNLYDLEAHKVNIYPNPSSGYVFIESKNSTNTLKQVKVLNSYGQIVQVEHDITSTIALDLNNQPKGHYFIWLSNEEDSIIKKITLN